MKREIISNIILYATAAAASALAFYIAFLPEWQYALVGALAVLSVAALLEVPTKVVVTGGCGRLPWAGSASTSDEDAVLRIVSALEELGMRPSSSYNGQVHFRFMNRSAVARVSEGLLMIEVELPFADDMMPSMKEAVDRINSLTLVRASLGDGGCAVCAVCVPIPMDMELGILQIMSSKFRPAVTLYESEVLVPSNERARTNALMLVKAYLSDCQEWTSSVDDIGFDSPNPFREDPSLAEGFASFLEGFGIQVLYQNLMTKPTVKGLARFLSVFGNPMDIPYLLARHCLMGTHASHEGTEGSGQVLNG